MIVHNSHYEKFADGTVRCIDDEIPFEIPSSWQWVRLRDVCTYLHRGKSPKYGEKKVLPIIAQKCNQWDKIYTDRCLFSSVDFIQKYLNEHYLQLGDIVVNSTGGGTVGRTGYVDTYVFEDYDKFVVDSHVTVIRPFQEICNRYIYFFLISPQIQIGVEERCSGSTNQLELGTNTISNYLVPLPPIGEQFRIAQKLSEAIPQIDTYDKEFLKRERLNEQINISLKKSILQEAIQGSLIPQCSKDEPASALLQRIKIEKERLIKEKKIKRDKQESIIFHGDDNCYFEKLSDGTVQKLEILFDIPESWEWVRLGDLVYNLSGLSYKKEDLEVKHDFPIRVLRGGNILDGTWMIKEDDVKISPQFVKPNLLLKAGTFITPAVSSFEQVGKTGLIETDLADTVVGGFVLMLIPFYKEVSLLRYLLYLFQTSFYKSLCQSIVNKSGQAFYNLSRTKLMNAAIPLPPIEEQLRIVKYLDAIFTHIR